MMNCQCFYLTQKLLVNLQQRSHFTVSVADAVIALRTEHWSKMFLFYLVLCKVQKITKLPLNHFDNSKGHNNNNNNIHEKITQFWLAEKGVQNVKHECKKSVTPVQKV